MLLEAPSSALLMMPDTTVEAAGTHRSPMSPASRATLFRPSPDIAITSYSLTARAPTRRAGHLLDAATIQPYGCTMQIAPPDFDRMFGALADHTRRDIVRRAIDAEEGVAELASHYSMSFAAVQKHVAILERAGLVTKERIGRRKVVRTNLEGLRMARRLLDRYEDLWRGRVDRMTDLVADTTQHPKETTG